MTLNKNLLDALVTSAGDTSVAIVAGVTLSDWVNYHIFTGESLYIRGKNRGRSPFVSIWRSSSDFSFDEENGGGVNSEYIIESVVSKTSKKDMPANEEFACQILQAVIKAAMANWAFQESDFKLDQVTNHPFGFSVKATFRVTNSWSKDFSCP
jgi:hypothetical protein